MGRGPLTPSPGVGSRVRRGIAIAGALVTLGLICVAAVASRGATVELAALASGSGVLWLMGIRGWARSQRALASARSAQEAGSTELKAMFDGTDLGLGVVNESGELLRINAAFNSMLGYDCDSRQLIGRNVRELTHPDDREETGRRLDEIRERGAGYEYAKRYLRADGGVIWAQVTVSRSVDPRTGKPLSFAQVQDITERKREQSLELAEERHMFSEFLDNVPMFVYFKDRESRFLRVSKEFADLWDVDGPAELIGKTDMDLIHDEHAVQARADELAIMETGEPMIDVEEMGSESPNSGHEGPDWGLTTKLPLRDVSGEIVGTFGISRDITSRKRAEAALSESEARWRALLAHLQEMVLLVDGGGRVMYAAPSVERWLGYNPEELLGVELVGVVHPDDVGGVAGALGAVTAEETLSVSYRVRHVDGSWHSLESTLICMRENPIVEAVLVAATDVTDRVRLEEERERLDLERRVSHRLEAVGQLAAGIAHEINTPLQFVGDSITFLRDAVEELLGLSGRYRELLWSEEPPVVEQWRAIMAEAEDQADIEYLRERIPAAFERTSDGVARVRSIVQAMKRFSHPSNGEIAPEDVNEAIDTTLAVCRNEYKYVAEVSLELGQLPLVPCNIGEINQVLLNLIVNAAQAIEEHRTAAGGESAPLGLITISTRVDGEHAVISIADDGPGIPQQLLERIYEPFFTTKEVGKGTGQGLALARTTIARHGGTLECVSAPGEGSIFTIRLPLQTNTPQPTPTSPEVARPGNRAQAVLS